MKDSVCNIKKFELLNVPLTLLNIVFNYFPQHLAQFVHIHNILSYFIFSGTPIFFHSHSNEQFRIIDYTARGAITKGKQK